MHSISKSRAIGPSVDQCEHRVYSSVSTMGGRGCNPKPTYPTTIFSGSNNFWGRAKNRFGGCLRYSAYREMLLKRSVLDLGQRRNWKQLLRKITNIFYLKISVHVCSSERPENAPKCAFRDPQKLTKFSGEGYWRIPRILLPEWGGDTPSPYLIHPRPIEVFLFTLVTVPPYLDYTVNSKLFSINYHSTLVAPHLPSAAPQIRWFSSDIARSINLLLITYSSLNTIPWS